VTSPLERLAPRDLWALRLQRAVAWVFTPFTYYVVAIWMRAGRKYAIPDLHAFRADVERKLRAADPDDTAPVLVCANHLTLIDSLVLIRALGSGLRYVFDQRRFAWNMPELRNLGSSPLTHAGVYLGKCLPVVRQGPQEQTARTLGKVTHLLQRRQWVMIFPEGTRSRSGRVDTQDFAYGVGKLVQDVPGTRVLCLYLRGRGQATFGNLPRKGETFDLLCDVLTPTSTATGMRGSRDISRAIVQRLAELEAVWFAAHPDSPRPPVPTPAP
jgi:hypothetical protein